MNAPRVKEPGEVATFVLGFFSALTGLAALGLIAGGAILIQLGGFILFVAAAFFLVGAVLAHQLSSLRWELWAYRGADRMPAVQPQSAEGSAAAPPEERPAFGERLGR